MFFAACTEVCRFCKQYELTTQILSDNSGMPLPATRFLKELEESLPGKVWSGFNWMTWSDAVYGQNCALEFVGKQCRKYQIVVGGPDYFNALSVHANILAGFCHVLSIRVATYDSSPLWHWESKFLVSISTDNLFWTLYAIQISSTVTLERTHSINPARGKLHGPNQAKRIEADWSCGLLRSVSCSCSWFTLGVL